MGDAPDRIRPQAVAKMTSLSVRKVQELSAAGKIPSAAKLGGVWTYDPFRVRAWIKAEEQQWLAPGRQASTSGATRGGAGAALPDASIDALYEQVIGGKRPGGSKRGGRNSNAMR